MSEGTEQKSSSTAFRLVIFQNIPETYQFDQPVTCTFTVDSSFSPSEKDLVGLYKVGWRSLHDHVSSVNIKLPLNDCSGTVTFKDVPKDDEEFYQFCYVSLSSHVYGASSPFQFVADDFEIIEDTPDASLLDADTICDETRDDKEVTTLFERPAVESTGSLERSPTTASSDLEDHLSKLTEENKKLADELSLLKMKLTESQLHGEEEDQKCVDGLKKSNLTSTSQKDHNGGMGDAATVATSSEETSQKEKMLYSMTTWFHNPYSHYIPSSVTDFSSVTFVTSELWPKNEIVRSNR